MTGRAARILLPAGSVVVLLILFEAGARDDGPRLRKRQSYRIDLPNLRIYRYEDTGEMKEVRIASDNSGSYSAIAGLNDRRVKVTRHGRETTVYREAWERAFIISEFEAKELKDVCGSLMRTLEDFEKNLQRKQWGKCLYLDGYFPRFLQSFYYLYCAARASSEAMPPEAFVPDSLFDPSLRSPKSDARVGEWVRDPEHVIKLRIITRELVYQLKEWEKKELKKRRKNPEVNYGEKLERAFALFVRHYFNLGSSDGEHE